MFRLPTVGGGCGVRSRHTPSAHHAPPQAPCAWHLVQSSVFHDSGVRRGTELHPCTLHLTSSCPRGRVHLRVQLGWLGTAGLTEGTVLARASRADDHEKPIEEAHGVDEGDGGNNHKDGTEGGEGGHLRAQEREHREECRGGRCGDRARSSKEGRARLVVPA